MLDPTGKRCNFSLVEGAAFGRHVLELNHFDEQTLFRVPRYDGRFFGFSALQRSDSRVQSQFAFFLVAVAFEAMVFEYRPNVGMEEYAPFGPGGLLFRLSCYSP